MGKVLIFGIIVLGLISMAAMPLGIGVSGGLAMGKGLPVTGWEVVTTGIEWIVDALTFSLDDMPGLIGSFMWLFVVVTIFIPVVYLIRGN